MLYYFGRGLMWITFRLFFRKIRIEGAEKLSHDKPAILIANHPASFLDAMVLSVFIKRSVYFFVRGDIFSNPIVYKILTMLHMVPIYSKDHGRDNLAKNKNTFNRGTEILKRNKLLLIFPEGFSRLTKTLEPFKKGTARVALQTAFDNDPVIDLTIESVSINYSYHGFRSDLVINVGESIALSDYKEVYQATPNLAISQLTSRMFSVFEKNVLHIKQHERTLYVESLLRMLFPDVWYNAKLFFDKGRIICEKVSSLSDEQYANSILQLSKYEKKLLSLGLQDEEISFMPTAIFVRSFILMLILPCSLIGFLFWGSHFRFTKWIADKTVTRIDFYTSVFCGIAGLMGLIWWILICLLAILFTSKIILTIVFISPLFFYISLQWKDELKRVIAAIKLKYLIRNEKNRYEELEILRRELCFWN